MIKCEKCGAKAQDGKLEYVLDEAMLNLQAHGDTFMRSGNLHCKVCKNVQEVSDRQARYFEEQYGNHTR